MAKTSSPGWNAVRGYFSLDLSLRNIYDKLFLIILFVDVCLRAFNLDQPPGSLIFDEWYYVNVARVILRIPQSVGGNGQPPYVNVPPSLDPNHEHPPLAKLIIALSMHLFGNNGFGWRIPSVIFGTVAVLAFYLLMKRVTDFKSVPLIATFLFSFDNLVFVQSRIATLDIFALAFMLLGLYWYFSGHSYLSAIGMALSALTKITGVAGFLIIVIMQAMKFATGKQRGHSISKFFSWFEKYFAVYVVCFFVLLTIMDRLWVGYTWPWEHIQYILSYSSALVSKCPNGIISCPWQWLINQIQIPYLIVSVHVSGAVPRDYNSVAFWGEMNPAILYLTIPVVLYAGYSYYQKKSDLTLLILVLFAVTYLPYYPAAIFGQRVTYLFYFLDTIPAICAGIAFMIADQNLPKLVVLTYLGVVLFLFFRMFPFPFMPF